MFRGRLFGSRLFVGRLFGGVLGPVEQLVSILIHKIRRRRFR